MSRRHGYKVQIDWKKVDHVKVKLEEKTISLDLKKTALSLPRVQIITLVNDSVMFQFSVYSWNSLIYPPDLINWTVYDPKKLIPEALREDLLKDRRIRILDLKHKTFFETIKHAHSHEWIYTSTSGDQVGDSPQTPQTPQTSEERPLHYMILECGDVMFPDTLSLKFRALENKYDCVIPNTLAYFEPLQNLSIALKLFLKMPRSGLYWRKKWWFSQSSSNMVGIPYIGNCITVGKPQIEGFPMQASSRFFDNFPSEVKEMIKKILISVQTNYDSDES